MTNSSFRNLPFVAIVLAGAGLMAVPVLAAQNPAPADQASDAASATKSSAADSRFAVSDQGFQAERDIRSARVAIFSGDINQAKNFLKQAKTDLDAVAKSSTAPVTASANGSSNDTQVKKADLIPIDGQMIIADDMIVTPDKSNKIDQANQHLKSGQTGEAMKAFKQGNIDIAFTRILMPLSTTVQHVAAAQSLVDSGKFYQASMALKAAEDSLQADTVNYVDPAGQNSAAQQNQPPKSATPKG